MKIKFISYLDAFRVVSACLTLKSYNEVYYFDISRTGKLLLRLLRLNQCIKPFIFSLDDVRDESGESRFVKITGDLNDICKAMEDEVLRKDSFIDVLGKVFNKDKVVFYFIKRLGLETKDIVAFINVIDWYQQKEANNKPWESVEFYIESTPCFEVLKEFALKKYNISLKSYPSLRVVNAFCLKFFGHLYLSITSCAPPIINFARGSGVYGSQKETDSVPMVASSCAPTGLTFDLTKRSRFFWLLKSEIPYEQVLIYFERKDIPATEVATAELRENGVKCVAMSKNIVASESISVYKPTIELAKVLSKLMARLFLIVVQEIFNFRFWSLVYLPGALNFIREYSKACDFYQSMGVKINVYNSTDFGSNQIPESLALESLGGVSVSYQMSNSVSSVLLGPCTDIFFMFGPYYYSSYSVAQKNKWINNTILMCGYITDYSFKTVKKYSKLLREKILSKGAKFILCYFDENSSNDRMSAIPNKKSAYIYEKLLNWVISDETIGLICSPKRPDTLLKRLPEIAELVEKAKMTGRCIFMESDDYRTSSYPTEAAQASNIVISLLLGGTTALESYLSGVRVLELDLEGLYSLNEYKRGRNKIIFDSVDNLIASINEYRCDPNSFSKLGNLSIIPAMEFKDTFKDGKASLRIGQYINWLLEMFNQRKTGEQAIEYANQRYVECWGRENIVKWH